ncbi:hypothetical protein N9Z80_05020, partial [Akkermansiaceae bacterium]|nr:hypothetical protein [Akkermansiaceae bacterium]
MVEVCCGVASVGIGDRDVNQASLILRVMMMREERVIPGRNSTEDKVERVCRILRNSSTVESDSVL